MKHYRILEEKIINQDNKFGKTYTTQYLKPLFFGLSYWKNLNDKRYLKYEDALSEVKKVIVQEDYETSTVGYHYIDAYKIFKTVKK